MKKTYKEFQEQELEKTVSPKFELGSQSVSEGMTSNVAKMTAIGLKKRCISLGNQVESATDIGEKINYLSKQLNAVAGIALVAVSMSDEGLLSKGMILTSLLSSNEPLVGFSGSYDMRIFCHHTPYFWKVIFHKVYPKVYPSRV